MYITYITRYIIVMASLTRSPAVAASSSSSASSSTSASASGIVSRLVDPARSPSGYI